MKDYEKLINELEFANTELGALSGDDIYKVHAIRMRLAKVLGILEAWKTFQNLEAIKMGEDYENS